MNCLMIGICQYDDSSLTMINRSEEEMATQQEGEGELMKGPCYVGCNNNFILFNTKVALVSSIYIIFYSKALIVLYIVVSRASDPN